MRKRVTTGPNQWQVRPCPLCRVDADWIGEPARQQAEEAVKLNPKDSSGHYLLGRVYQRLGRKELAGLEFRKTADLIHDKDANSHGGMASGVSSRQP